MNGKNGSIRSVVEELQAIRPKIVQKFWVFGLAKAVPNRISSWITHLYTPQGMPNNTSKKRFPQLLEARPFFYNVYYWTKNVSWNLHTYEYFVFILVAFTNLPISMEVSANSLHGDLETRKQFSTVSRIEWDLHGLLKRLCFQKSLLMFWISRFNSKQG